MRIDIISAFPSLLESPFSDSILKRAINNALVSLVIHDLREYGVGKHRQIDDYQFGGSAGMVMTVEPLYNAINKLKKEREYDEIIYMTPDGGRFDQPMANELSLKKNLMIICGHYKGIDHRLREHVITKEISIGDYVLSGGELAAAVVSDAIIRLLPGVLNDESSALSDSFQDNLLAPPIYTRPSEFNGWKVPDILLSGNFPEIDKWRHEQAEARTKQLRPDLFKKNQSSEG